MSKAWSERSAAERQALEAAFVARHGAELLLDVDSQEARERDPGTPRTPRRPPFARLHAAVHSGGPLPADVSEALRADPELREDFGLLLQRSAWQHLPRAAAAAGREALHRREAGGFTLRLVASRAGPDQVYLLIELPEESPPGDTDPAPEPERGGAGGHAPPGLKHEAGPIHGPRGNAPLGPTVAVPGQIVVKTAGGEFLKQDLPPPEARTIRLVMAADDTLVRAVGEPASEIFLL